LLSLCRLRLFLAL